MKTIHRNRKPILIAFLVSLLFHMSFITYVLMHKTNPINDQLIKNNKPEHKSHDNKPWAATKAASNGGAPVFFRNSPQPLIAETEEQSEQPIAALEQHINVPQPEEIIALPEHHNAPITQRIQRTKKKRKKTIHKQSNQPTPKRLPTLAQLTQGFLNHTQHDSKHLVTILGKKNSTPTDEQIKYEQYLQKISACINTACATAKPFIMFNYTENDAHILIAINRDGSLQHMSIRQSSGNRALDAYLVAIFRDASSSFPPLPHYLPDNPLMITCIVPIKVQEHSNISFHIR